MGDVRRLWIEGPTGRLEGAMRFAASPRAAAVIAHAHPLYGGPFTTPWSSTPTASSTGCFSGDEDPTRVTISASPVFLVQKISTDLTGDPNVLLAGETLRYTSTVKNIGNSDAAGVVLRDVVPVNTTYVAGSTTQNGAAVPDVTGLSPLVNGMPIHSPADPTPGSMPADASSNPANVATVTFDVVVDPDVVDGTILSNQGFVSAVAQGIVDRPSDDPDTPIADDPTRDIVGNLLRRGHADGFRAHDFVGQMMFEHSILMNPGFVGERVCADNRLVRLHRNARVIRRHPRRARDLGCVDPSVQFKNRRPRAQSHHDFFQ